MVAEENETSKKKNITNVIEKIGNLIFCHLRTCDSSLLWPRVDWKSERSVRNSVD